MPILLSNTPTITDISASRSRAHHRPFIPTHAGFHIPDPPTTKNKELMTCFDTKHTGSTLLVARKKALGIFGTWYRWGNLSLSLQCVRPWVRGGSGRVTAAHRGPNMLKILIGTR